MDDDDDNDALDAELIALLSDPTIWDEPSDSLEDRVVAGIAEERRVVVPMVRRRRAWPGWIASAAVGAAAAAAVVLIVAHARQRAESRFPSRVRRHGTGPDRQWSRGHHLVDIGRPDQVLGGGLAPPRG